MANESRESLKSGESGESGPPSAARQIGRYAMFGELASGGMATVHLGRLAGAAGFARIVAIKALRPQYAEDPDFVSMFIDEARLAARIHHPNVVPTLDVVSSKNELFTVMDYVHGETLSRLIRASKGTPIPLPIVSAVLRDVLNGLHAAHESTNEHGEPLGVVHRDVSPQNVIVGADGVSRVLDFGVAKATGRIQTTREGQLKGKIAYMAPEQYHGEVSRLTDVFAASVVLWETIVGEKLFTGNEGEIVAKILQRPIPKPGEKREISAELEAVVMRGLSREPAERYPSALAMADALVESCPPATSAEVGAWVESLAAETLRDRQMLIREMETEPRIPAKIASIPAPADVAQVPVPAPPAASKKRNAVGVAIVLVACVAIAIVIASAGSHKDPPVVVAPPSQSTAAITTASAPPTETANASTDDSSRPQPPPTATREAQSGTHAVSTAATHHATIKPAPSATTPDHI